MQDEISQYGRRLRRLVSVALRLLITVPLFAQTSTSDVPLVPGSFVDITLKTGINFPAVASHTSHKYLIETMGSGVATFDYDNDGLLDIFLVNGATIADPTPKGTVPQKSGPQQWNRLFHQKKDGTFEDVTEKAGVQGSGYGMGVAVGDYDNDGFEDLFVTAYGNNRLYRNNGNGTFSDVTEKSGTAGSQVPGEMWSTSAAWLDMDNDGFLDLMVLRYVRWDFDDVWCGEHRPGYRSYCHPDIFPAIAALVYHNNGDGTFTEIAQKIGLGSKGKGLGLAIADFDRDGKIDIAVANAPCLSSSFTTEATAFSKKSAWRRRSPLTATDAPMPAWASISKTSIMTDFPTSSSRIWQIRSTLYIGITVTVPLPMTPTSRVLQR